MKYILWGIGKCANLIWDEIKGDVVIVVDGNTNLWGNEWNGHIVKSPDELKFSDIEFDKIIIASVEWKRIKDRLLREYGIKDKYIENMFFLKRKKFLDEYKDLDLNKEEMVYFEHIKNYPLEVFNDKFSDNYIDYDDVKIEYDSLNELFYVYHYGKKMYFSREFKSEKRCARYYKSLLMEQDENSPHRYRTKDFDVKKGEIVLDAGVAEGNFALEVVDLVEKLYLVEADKNWIEALEHTFFEYRHKVEIVHGFLGNGKNGTVTIDRIIKDNKIDLIKMDIEGAEKIALEGARETLSIQHPKMLLCTYHNQDDYDTIEKFLKDYSYKTEPSKGYMVFLNLDNYKQINIPKLVRGLIRGE